MSPGITIRLKRLCPGSIVLRSGSPSPPTGSTPNQTEEVISTLKKLKKPAEYHLIESDYGHDSFLVEPEKFTPMVAAFLDQL